MSAPLRIRRPSKFGPEAEHSDDPGTPTPADGFKDYLNRLVKMIPSEIIGLYMIGSGYIDIKDKGLIVGWSIACFILVFVVRIFGTSDKRRNVPPEWPAIFISAAAFIIWLYWLGGPFQAYGIQKPSIASLAVLIFSFIAPYFYKE
jgi:hypothetical protein